MRRRRDDLHSILTGRHCCGGSDLHRDSIRSIRQTGMSIGGSVTPETRARHGMKKKLALWCRLLADWLDPIMREIEVLPDLSALNLRARLLTAQQELGAGSGEYKRHQVYAQLIKDFPLEKRRNISMAIEDAVRAL